MMARLELTPGAGPSFAFEPHLHSDADGHPPRPGDHVRVVVRAGTPGSRALCGDLIFRAEEWELLASVLAVGTGMLAEGQALATAVRAWDAQAMCGDLTDVDAGVIFAAGRLVDGAERAKVGRGSALAQATRDYFAALDRLAALEPGTPSWVAAGRHMHEASKRLRALANPTPTTDAEGVAIDRLPAPTPPPVADPGAVSEATPPVDLIDGVPRDVFIRHRERVKTAQADEAAKRDLAALQQIGLILDGAKIGRGDIGFPGDVVERVRTLALVAATQAPPVDLAALREADARRAVAEGCLRRAVERLRNDTHRPYENRAFDVTSVAMEFVDALDAPPPDAAGSVPQEPAEPVRREACGDRLDMGEDAGTCVRPSGHEGAHDDGEGLSWRDATSDEEGRS